MTRLQFVAALTVASIPCPAFGQSTEPAVATFEAVSVKPAIKMESRGMVQFGIIANNVTIRHLIRHAYEMQEAQVLGPAWIGTERFNVTARPKGPASAAQLRILLQKLLEEHFKLDAHRETKELPAYWLTVAEGGPKLADPSEERAFNAAARANPPFKPGFDAIFKLGDLPAFAERLSRMIGSPVIDKTGIEGQFWFQLEWAAE